MPTADSSNPSAERWLRRLPSPMVIFTAALGGTLLAVTLGKGVQDADYFWHLTAGRLIARTGSVPSSDPFSFTWAGQPWTPHEWLSELIVYWLTEAFGRVGALAVFGLVPGAALAMVAAMLARRGVRVRSFAMPAVLVAAVTAPYVTLRPQAISWLFLAGLVWLLSELRPDRPRRVLWLVPFFMVWANLHGLYVAGLGVVAVYALFTMLGRTPMSPAWRWVALASIGCLLAGMATPAGPIGLLYPLHYLEGGDWGLANIQEWQSPDFHAAAHWPFLALIVAVGLNAGRATPGWLVALSWIGIALGLTALRNVPIAAVLCLPTLAMGLAARLEGWGRQAASHRGPTAAVARRVIELVTALVVVVAALVTLAPRGIGDEAEARLAERYPVAAVERLAELMPDANVLAEYGWGGYVIYELHDRGGRVFVDGRNDMYAQRILEDYDRIRTADSDWEQLADTYQVEAILLMPEAPLTRGPAEAAGWCEAYRDDHQVLYLRTCPA
ncbi:MAG TPA: hypothetical protein VES36_09500 [Candidatus Limnocylindrales bacterium]|nr:hypothetical protein [Candidatus Limnocylindrales bacterium]